MTTLGLSLTGRRSAAPHGHQQSRTDRFYQDGALRAPGLTASAAHGGPSFRAAHPKVSQLPGKTGRSRLASLAGLRQVITPGAPPS